MERNGMEHPKFTLTIIDQELDSVKEIMRQLEVYDITTSHYKHLEELCSEIKENANSIPDILLIEMHNLDQPQSLDLLPQFRQIANLYRTKRNQHTITIGYSGDYSLECKFRAAKAELSGFIQKPLKATELVDKLDELIFFNKDEPMRVMIVDDTPLAASSLSEILEDAGMHTIVVLEPEHAIDMLTVFQPDIALIDLYMPKINGDELVRTIRYHPKFNALSLIYVSSEEDINIQHRAIQCGADDFIPKSLPAQTFALSIEAKARRARYFNSLLITDELTGLYNYSYCLERLYQRMERAQRNALPLAMALLNIDNFKELNDEHGHKTGDSILRVIARILQHRLRKSDIIGRNIGVGFFIVLPDTSEQAALAIIDNLRMNFAKVKHEAPPRAPNDLPPTFQTTFSASIACYPKYETVDSLLTAAETRLIKIQNKGPNQVELA